MNHAEDDWWRAPFADIGLGDPPAISMHVDHLWTTKAILYLSEVGADNGPFCYCLGSNHVQIGWLEGAARRANDRIDLSSCAPESRRLFTPCPGAYAARRSSATTSRAITRSSAGCWPASAASPRPTAI